MDRLRLRAVAGGAALAAAAGIGAAATPTHLVDGSPSPPVPAALRRLHHPVVAALRIVRVPTRPRSVRSCVRMLRQPAARRKAFVERVGVAGRSVTYVSARGVVLACDGTRARGGRPWCGVAAGTRVRGRLRDPRLDITCRNRARRVVAFAWVEPRPRARWIAVDHGSFTELYRTARRLPVRVASARHVDLGHARARFAIAEYDAGGRRVGREEIEARVAG